MRVKIEFTSVNNQLNIFNAVFGNKGFSYKSHNL